MFTNPTCRTLTLAGASTDKSKTTNIGIAAHITAASENGPRYDSKITSEQRKSIANAIFLSENCASLIDKNKGIDFPVAMLQGWKVEHEEWIRDAQSKPLRTFDSLSIVDISAHLESSKFPCLDIKILNNSDDVFQS